MRVALLTKLLGALVLLSGCSARPSQPVAITLATTTSTQDSGLLDNLLPAFEEQSKIKVNVVAVGSGQAIELGRRGDADVLLTHSPAAEDQFVAEGSGAKRLPVMHNDFVVVGPAADLAHAKEQSTAREAFRAIHASAQPFVSRGDDSGTHQKELAIWKTAERDPSGPWYIRAGASMARALQMASEKQAYILADRATYLALKQQLKLSVVLEGDKQLLNHYSVIVVSKTKHPHIHESQAQAFAEFLTSPEGRKRIASFGLDKFGEPLFTPDTGGNAGESPK